MSTRAQVRFATRESGQSFATHPKVVNAQFYVHFDGYPESLGVEIAESFTRYKKIKDWEIEELNTRHDDLEYIYYIWQHPMKETFISIFKVKPFQDQTGECIFVGRPSNLIDKYN
jgi:hypothetical protein|tara:strand:- start:371 stop:715 length:345 start_codon:yes stop_codon:yes gene_type:complete